MKDENCESIFLLEKNKLFCAKFPICFALLLCPDRPHQKYENCTGMLCTLLNRTTDFNNIK